ncbi:MAG: hypothetical protein EA427_17005 [Spirochaetaceae bacterium]|nr:MAG: hypothetical protein EA427_17005 [Spirochaetaceae bacterium]
MSLRVVGFTLEDAPVHSPRLFNTVRENEQARFQQVQSRGGVPQFPGQTDLFPGLPVVTEPDQCFRKPYPCFRVPAVEIQGATEGIGALKEHLLVLIGNPPTKGFPAVPVVLGR